MKVTLIKCSNNACLLNGTPLYPINQIYEIVSHTYQGDCSLAILFTLRMFARMLPTVSREATAGVLNSCRLHSTY